MKKSDQKSAMGDTNGQSQSRTPQGGGQGSSGDNKSGGRDSSQDGGQND